VLLPPLKQRIDESVRYVLSQRLWQPTVALVLGSGLGALAERVTHASRLAYSDIPHFCPTHADGHAGELVMGYLAGLPVVMLQGRAHRYEGIAHCQASFPVQCMQSLGASILITTNAAGGLNPRYRPGDLMVIDSHIDFLWARGMWEQSSTPPLSPSRIPPYDSSLRERAKGVACRLETPLQQGCYLATLGPTYETRSEYRMFRWMDADAVGMSTLPEVLAAQALGMRTLAFSVISNVASTDVPQATTHAEVVAACHAAGPRLMDIIEGVLQELSGQPD
jgi:purine-nucleoside phosphorylase